MVGAVRWRQQDVTAPVNQQIDQQRSDNRYLRLKVANNRLLAVHQPYLIIHIDPHQRVTKIQIHIEISIEMQN